MIILLNCSVEILKSDEIVGGSGDMCYFRIRKSLPHTINVLGLFLFGKNVSRSAMVRLKENPNNDILDVLQISYNGLEDSKNKYFLTLLLSSVWKRRHR